LSLFILLKGDFMKRNIKVIIVALLAIILIWSSVVPMGAVKVVRYYGDIDDDAYVTTKDARIALMIAAGIYEETLYGVDYDAANIDGLGTVTLEDARIILRVAAGQVALRELVTYEFDEKPEVSVEKLNDYRFEQDHTAVKYTLSPELCDAAKLAAQEYATKTGTAFTRENGTYYYKLLDDLGIKYTAVDKIVITSSASYDRALKVMLSDPQAEKTINSGDFTNIGVSAYSSDGRTFYWCIFLTK
jgi:hypothetical protein